MLTKRRGGPISWQTRFPGFKRINGNRRLIAEVFEDLATESIVELEVYETFLDLNPQVREFPNLSPGETVFRGEERLADRNRRNQMRRRTCIRS